MKNTIKSAIQGLPASIGCQLAFINFKYRLGNAYTRNKAAAETDLNKGEVFQKLFEMVKYSQDNIPFYQTFYQKKGFHYSQLNSLDDVTKIPVLTKEDLQKVAFEKRISNLQIGTVTNTGGTSGQPLKLLMDDEAHAREWGHMHTIWNRLGYKTNCLKLTLRGMNLGDKPLIYNFIHNEFQVNAYCKFELVAKALDKKLKRYNIEFLHGYPSGIYEFLKQLEASYPKTLNKLKANLKGVFFGSEFPAPIYRDHIESLLNVPTISWYGHTEMAVLAHEKETPFVYYPFQSYGFTESVEIDGKQHLVGTTLHNKVGPLIRYDTGDIIEPLTYKGGMLESFEISEGRVGEFVCDVNGRNISLTALIFGRHHEIFTVADFIQVKQPTQGELTIYVTSSNQHLNCASLFDAKGMNMNITFEVIASPFKTPAGKIPLIVKG